MPTLFADSFNPLRSFRQKTKSFRLRHRRQSTVFSDTRSQTDSPAKKHSACHLDPEYSIDQFFRRLSRRMSTHVKHEKVAEPALKSFHQISRIHSYKTFNHVLDSTTDVLRILNHLTPADIRSMRLVCRKLDTLIQRHPNELPKEEVFTLDLLEDDFGNLGPRKFGSKEAKNWMKLELIDKPLRHVQPRNVSFHDTTITGKTIKYLHRAVKYPLMELKFFNCRFQLRSTDFAICIKPWKPCSLELHQCVWEPSEDIIEEEEKDYFITDRFFSINDDIKFLCFDFSRQNEQVFGLTHKLVHMFKQKEDKFGNKLGWKLPWKLIMHNVFNFFTAKTLFIALSGYMEAAHSHTDQPLPTCYSWTFGRCNDTKENILHSLCAYMHHIVADRSTHDMINVTFQVRPEFPPLMFVVYLTKVLPEIEDLDEALAVPAVLSKFDFLDEEDEGMYDSESDDEIDFDEEDEGEEQHIF